MKSFGKCWGSNRLWLVVKSLYFCSEVCVHVGEVKSRPLTVGVGLRQRFVSPFLFMAYISGSQPFRWWEPNPDLHDCFVGKPQQKFLMQFNWHVLFYSGTKSVTQNFRRFIERLLMASQRVPGSRMRPSEPGWAPLVDMNWIDSHNRVDEGHIQEVQDQPFTLCIRFGVLVACSQHAKTTEVGYYVSLKTQGTVCGKWAAMHCSRWRSTSTYGWYLRVVKGGARRLIHGLVKLTLFCVSFFAL